MVCPEQMGVDPDRLGLARQAGRLKRSFGPSYRPEPWSHLASLGENCVQDRNRHTGNEELSSLVKLVLNATVIKSRVTIAITGPCIAAV
jgi:hypothetical protein